MARSTEIKVTVSQLFVYEFTLGNGRLKDELNLAETTKLTGDSAVTFFQDRDVQVALMRAMGLRKTFFIVEEANECVELCGDEMTDDDLIVEIKIFD